MSGAPTLALAIGSPSRGRPPSTASTAASVRFRYVVQAADRDADGLAIAAGALALNGGSIRDAAGNDAVLGLGVRAIADEPSHKVDGGSSATPAVAAVTITSTPAANGTYKRAETLEVAVRFSRAVAVTGSPQLTLSIASGDRTAAWNRAGASPTTHYFRYTVQQSDVDANGLSILSGALTLNGGAIRGGAVDADLSLGTHAIAQRHRAQARRRHEPRALRHGRLLRVAAGARQRLRPGRDHSSARVVQQAGGGDPRGVIRSAISVGRG